MTPVDRNRALRAIRELAGCSTLGRDLVRRLGFREPEDNKQFSIWAAMAALGLASDLIGRREAALVFAATASIVTRVETEQETERPAPQPHLRLVR